jgi:hypothetical protein
MVLRSVVLSILLAINQPLSLCYRIHDPPPSWAILKAIVLPYSTYFIGLASGALLASTHIEFARSFEQPRIHENDGLDAVEGP